MTACTLLSVDLDGTLVDTAGEIAEAANRTLDDFGVPRRSVAQIARLIGMGTRELMLRLLAELMHEEPVLVERLRVDDVLARLERHYGMTAGTCAVPFAGAREAMQRLAAAGVRLACVTNKELRHARRVLEATRLIDCFELVVGGDSLPQKKPHASVLWHAQDAFGVQREHMAHVGDSAIDVMAARAAGVRAWVVAHGYDGVQGIADARPDRRFRDLAEVAAHVLAGRIDLAAAPMPRRRAGAAQPSFG